MNRSLYTKLIAIILVLILSLTLVMGAFLVRGVRSYYVSQFYIQMQEVFSNKDLVDALRAVTAEEGGAEQMADILGAYSRDLGINAGTRNYYILDGETGECITGSELDSVDQIQRTHNILTAISGTEGYASDKSADFMDVGLPIQCVDGEKYIVYVIDNKSTVESLNDQLTGIIFEAMGIGLLISIALGLLLAKTVITPIQNLTKAAEKVASGDFSQKVENQAMDEIGVLTRTFNNMADQLENNIEDLKNSEKMRRDFVANVSHELRTPITSIRSYAETLEEAEGTLPKDMEQHFLKVIVNESDRMTKIVQDLLTLSKFDAGSYTFEFRNFSFEKSIRDVYSAQRLEAQRHHHEFSLEFKDRLPEIRGDRLRIEQVLTNMVSNAIKYTHDGGRISMTAGVKGDNVWCTVKDNGVGIPENDLKHIFERFYRVDKARSRESGGTGLGLSIAYEIVDRHDGSIDAKSKKGRGTAFTVTLPIGGPSDD